MYTLNSAHNIKSYRERSFTKSTLTKSTRSRSMIFDKCFTPLKNTKNRLKVSKILSLDNILGG
jgi:hypothetical protein